MYWRLLLDTFRYKVWLSQRLHHPLSDSCLSAYPAFWLWLAKLQQRKTCTDERLTIWLSSKSLCGNYFPIETNSQWLVTAESDHYPLCLFSHLCLSHFICPFVVSSLCHLLFSGFHSSQCDISTVKHLIPLWGFLIISRFLNAETDMLIKTTVSNCKKTQADSC